MKIDRFTWLGLGIAVVGWLVLIVDMMVSEQFLQAGNAVAVTALRSDIVAIAQTTINCGLALAVIGTLRSGFGTLHRFFDSVLDRSFDSKPMAPMASVEPVEPYVMAQPMHTSGLDRMSSTAPIGSTGSIKDRNYVILPDGSVEVETLLGTRIFASLDEARDFIR